MNALQLPVHPAITVTAATIGPIGLRARRALHIEHGNEALAHAVLLLLPAGTCAPENCSGWRHRFVDGELPLLVLTGAAGRAAHHLACNLFDSGTRGAFESAMSSGTLELLTQAAYGGTTQLTVPLASSELDGIRAHLRRYRRAQGADSNAWWTRMFLAANELPAAISKDEPLLAHCGQHIVSLLSGDADVHASAIDLALARAGRGAQ